VVAGKNDWRIGVIRDGHRLAGDRPTRVYHGRAPQTSGFVCWGFVIRWFAFRMAWRLLTLILITREGEMALCRTDRPVPWKRRCQTSEQFRRDGRCTVAQATPPCLMRVAFIGDAVDHSGPVRPVPGQERPSANA